MQVKELTFQKKLGNMTLKSKGAINMAFLQLY